MDRALAIALTERFGSTLLTPVRQRFDETEIRVSVADAIQTLRALHDEQEFSFEMLIDLCGVDTGEEMQVVYHLSSSRSGDWLRVIVPGIDRTAPRVSSLVSLWPGAEWMEREAYDMFGIIFEGNRDLRRIYMPDDYVSHPLRKDFYLADDASRSPAAGVRNMERVGTPVDATSGTTLRKSRGA
jgi:NADH-quinone oxidoreductase subunit C